MQIERKNKKDRKSYNLKIDYNIIGDYRSLKNIKYNSRSNNRYIENLQELISEISKYNKINPECKLILSNYQNLDRFELYSYINRLGKTAVYIDIPVRASETTRYEKYGLRYDYIKKSWFTQDYENYYELKMLNNVRLNEMYKSKQEKLAKI